MNENRLDWRQKQPVTYAVPLWLRDAQIAAALARKLPRIEPVKEDRGEPIAVVCFGPSLQDTWEKVRDYRYVMSCSGSHRFLVERGIIPTWHVEVDPRAHKVVLIGEPQKQTAYLIASTCHPAVFDHLKDYDVRLWHVFDADAEALRLLPAGEFALTGGCDVGLRSLVMAAFFGFRDLHVFGMDGSARETKHAAEHPNTLKKFQECEYGGVVYKTTTGMLEAARSIWHELDQMPKVKATFYGEGLVQHMARDYQPRPAKLAKWLVNTVAFAKRSLISDDYRDQNARLHAENPAYGVGGTRHVETVLKLADNPAIRSILDYGCGKGYLGRALAVKGVPIFEYDPAIPGKQESPRPADLVVCTDVLEHIEPDRLLGVLSDIQRCLKVIGYFTIHTGPAQKTLPDGRNTHLIQRDAQWWGRMLSKFFEVGKIIVKGPELHVAVGPLVSKHAKAKISAVKA
jgi:uncharacterized Rossmann fold enzyme